RRTLPPGSVRAKVPAGGYAQGCPLVIHSALAQAGRVLPLAPVLALRLTRPAWTACGACTSGSTAHPGGATRPAPTTPPSTGTVATTNTKAGNPCETSTPCERSTAGPVAACGRRA